MRGKYIGIIVGLWSGGARGGSVEQAVFLIYRNIFGVVAHLGFRDMD